MPFRGRVGSVLEWVVAAGLLAVTVAVISRLAHEPRPGASAPAAARRTAALGTDASPPAAIPAGAVSVPVLPLDGGAEVRIGATRQEVADLLGRSGETGRQTVDRGPHGTRVTRFYERGGVRFALVFDAGPGGPEPVVTAIYLQEREQRDGPG
jgi:hypothetical protein